MAGTIFDRPRAIWQPARMYLPLLVPSRWHDDHSRRSICADCAVQAGRTGGRQVDRSFASKGLLPPWYLALRLPLTLAAVAGMSLTLVASVREAEAAVPHEAEAAAPRNAAGQAAAGGGTAGAQEMELAAQPRSRQ